MSAVLIVGSRRCGPRCYEARPSERCSCVCQGVCHGAGRRQAQRAMVEVGEYLLDALEARQVEGRRN